MEVNILAAKKRADSLQAYAKTLLQCKKGLAGFKLMKKRSEKRRLLSAISKHLDATRVPVGLKTVHTACLNELASALDGMANGIHSSRFTFNSINEANEIVAAKLKKVQTRIKAVEADTDDAEMRDEVQKTLERTGREIKNIQKAKTRKYILCRAPVVPITNNAYIDMATLKRYFDASSINYYPVMHNQLVLGLNKILLGKAGVKDVRSYAKEIVDTIGKLRGVRYIFIYNKGIVSEKTGMGIVWYWLMTEAEANRFRQAFRNYSTSMGNKTLGVKTISLKDWGFANAVI